MPPGLVASTSRMGSVGLLPLDGCERTLGLVSIESARTHSGMLSRLTVAPMGSHLVELYEDEEILAETVAEFLAPALGGGGVAVIVATPEHRRSFTVALCAADLDVAAARRAGRLVELDARETLSRFMVDTSPDPGLFEEVIGGLLATMPAMSGDLFVYGEMVALLWDDGNGA